MLNLLGLLLKAIISLAIGIIGFTWEPKEVIEPPSKKDKRSEHILPASLNTSADVPYYLLSTPLTKTTCTDAPGLVFSSYPALRLTGKITDHGIAI